MVYFSDPQGNRLLPQRESDRPRPALAARRGPELLLGPCSVSASPLSSDNFSFQQDFHMITVIKLALLKNEIRARQSMQLYVNLNLNMHTPLPPFMILEESAVSLLKCRSQMTVYKIKPLFLVLLVLL